MKGRQKGLRCSLHSSFGALGLINSVNARRFVFMPLCFRQLLQPQSHHLHRRGCLAGGLGNIVSGEGVLHSSFMNCLLLLLFAFVLTSKL